MLRRLDLICWAACASSRTNAFYRHYKTASNTSTLHVLNWSVGINAGTTRAQMKQTSPVFSPRSHLYSLYHLVSLSLSLALGSSPCGWQISREYMATAATAADETTMMNGEMIALCMHDYVCGIMKCHGQGQNSNTLSHTQSHTHGWR